MMSSGGGGAGGVCSLSGRRSRGGAAIALSDGMVVVVSASTTATTTTALAAGVDHDDNDPGRRPSVQQQQLRWGVSPVVDQHALAYPAVGIGFVAVEQHKAGCRSKASSFVACCLRGTSTYLIPIDDDGGVSLERAATNAVPPPRPLIALSLPQDIEEDSAYRYVQSFAAGTLSIRPDKTNDGEADLLQDAVDHHQDEIPILIYAWPSGVISVYSCELLQYDVASDSKEQLLRQLVADGSAELLRNLLLSLAGGGGDDVDHQGGIGLADTAWDDALIEVRQFRGPVPLNVDDVCSSGNLASFRTVLIRLSS